MGTEQKTTPGIKFQEPRRRGKGMGERFTCRHTRTQMHRQPEGGKKRKKGKKKDI